MKKVIEYKTAQNDTWIRETIQYHDADKVIRKFRKDAEKNGSGTKYRIRSINNF